MFICIYIFIYNIWCTIVDCSGCAKEEKTPSPHGSADTPSSDTAAGGKSQQGCPPSQKAGTSGVTAVNGQSGAQGEQQQPSEGTETDERTAKPSKGKQKATKSQKCTPGMEQAPPQTGSQSFDHQPDEESKASTSSCQQDLKLAANVDVTHAAQATAQTRPQGDSQQPGVEERNQHRDLVLRLVPHAEVVIFGAFSIGLFLIQAYTHKTCGYTLGKVIDDTAMMESFNTTVKNGIYIAKGQYDVLFPFNIFTTLFVCLQVS